MTGLGRRMAVLALAIGVAQAWESTTALDAAPDHPGWPCVSGQPQVGTSPNGAPICATVIRTLGTAHPKSGGGGTYLGGYAARPAIAIGDDGHPVVAFSRGESPITTSMGRLRVVGCGNRGCTAGNVATDVGDAWGDPGFWSGSANTGWTSSIALLPIGVPLITSFDHWHAALRVTLCLSPACDVASTPYTIDDNAPATGYESVGRFTSLALGADGLPIIASQGHIPPPYGPNAAHLRLTHCSDPYCSGASTTTMLTPYATDDEGWDARLAVGADGRPVIAHISNGRIAVTRCGDVACTWAVSRAYLDPSYTGRGPSIAIGADGLPIVAYRRGTGGTLRVTHCGSAGCTAGNASTSFGTSGPIAMAYGGDTSAIAIGAEGRPIVAFDWSLPQNLLLLRCATATCAAAASTVTVDASADDVGAYPALAIGVDDLPVMAYVNRTTNAIRVAKCGTLSCA
jgi:hypothetical protein